ncbi:outer membrane beta-barrel family protein [Flavobacterium sp. SM15]|uniref:outer membrane beta-barrel family protein n=1 Tax=Flavobacterium sp. SM15 TaxID=2908005 RepID=UPI001EDBE740|nr:outer membrane beta-barrel family protein [Flavobacterium sp. SM15]MCG2611721.1 outer membrane beta-barrel family protein [Flavobacterium sp. SM15]
MKNQLILALSTFLISSIAYSQEVQKEQDVQKEQEEKKEQKETELEGVVVKAAPKTFTTKNGNIKLDVANSIFNAVPNTLDLLSKLPKIQISPDKESITVIGKGNPLIYIDNQKVEINDLNALDVADIKTIEIINNPSSKYEANGRVVILITRKLSKKEGIKVDLTENASFKKFFNNSFGVRASLKKNKTEFKTNFNYNQLTVWESNGNDFDVSTENITSNYLTEAVTKRPQFLFGSGIFHKINEDDYVSFNFNGRTQKDRFDITTDTYNKDENSENFIKTLNSSNEKRNFYNAFFNYNHKIKSIEGLLFTGVQYSRYAQNLAGNIYHNYNANGYNFSQSRDQKFNITVFSARTDFEKTFKNEMKLEVGALVLKADATTDFYATIQNPAAIQTSDYTFKERNIAGYTQLSGNLKKVNYSFGLRTEQTIIEGNTISNAVAVSINKNYNNLFPKAQLNFAVDSTKTITLNYSKSIVRPNYSATNQTLTYINPYFAFANNVNLNPTIIDEISATFEYKNSSLLIAYTKKSNPVYFGTFYDASENLLTLKTANFEKESGFIVEFTVPYTYKFWTVNNVFNGIINRLDDKTAVAIPTKPYFYGYSNSVFKLPKEIELSVTGWGLSSQYEGVFKSSGLFSMDLAVSKTFFKHFDCTVSANDIFRKVKYSNTYSMNGIHTKGNYYTDSHMISVTVKYSFGKIKDAVFKEKSIDENTNRIR